MEIRGHKTRDLRTKQTMLDWLLYNLRIKYKKGEEVFMKAKRNIFLIIPLLCIRIIMQSVMEKMWY